jgi:co-chaperonin GroES (HSP10)/phage FluMu protein Com
MFTQNELNDAVKGMEAYYDRIVVLQDEYKSGRECVKCKGKGHLDVKCPQCKGTKQFKGKYDGECPDCTIGSGPLSKTLGHVPCDLCAGQGTSSIIVPEDAEKRPTTGVITSVGHMCRFMKTPEGLIPRPSEQCLAVGDRVIFTNFSGNVYELGSHKNKSVVRILKEAEVLGILRNTPEVTPKAQEFSELSAAGMNRD